MGGFDVSYCQDLDGGRRSVEPSVSEGEHFVGSGPFRKALHEAVCKAVGLSGELDLLVRPGAGSVEPNWSDRQRLSQPLRVLSTQTGLVAFPTRGKPLSMSR
jgi:hypothetical protein